MGHNEYIKNGGFFNRITAVILKNIHIHKKTPVPGKNNVGRPLWAFIPENKYLSKKTIHKYQNIL